MLAELSRFVKRTGPAKAAKGVTAKREIKAERTRMMGCFKREYMESEEEE
jgi:hypothetical protein